ncbi:MAG: undecaprenyl-diphosphate phosphatase [Eubacteriales bacterium]|nr:undecaprenyl-diphosphate phosphatase [Eubacteriales bacterium]
MTLLKAIIMGLIQGLTEFLPISSSGHLAIFGNIMDLQGGGILFEVLLHVGTLVAVFIAFYKDLLELIMEGFSLLGRCAKAMVGKIKWKDVLDNEKKYFVLYILISIIPTVILGLFLKKLIEYAYTGTLIPGIGLLLTGALLLYTMKLKTGKKEEKDMTALDAVLVGLAQGIATLPGISRSGSTIVAARMRGLTPELAVKFSFIMSIPAILGAAILEMKDGVTESLGSGLLMYYGIGAAVAAVSGFFCIRWLLDIIKKGKIYYFAYYCFAMGVLAIILHFVLR